MLLYAGLPPGQSNLELKMSSDQVQYTHGYKLPALAGLNRRTAESHASWLLPRLKPGDRVLDAGPGPGTITLGLARAVSPGKVTGVEIGQPYVDLATETARNDNVENVEFLQGDALDLDFDDETFDVVFSFAVLEHIPEPIDALREWYRVLKPGGLIAVGSSAVSWHAHPLDAPLGPPKMNFYYRVWETNGGHPDMAADQPQLVRRAGFQDIEIGGFFQHSDPQQQASTWPERFRDPDFIKQAVDAGFASAEEIEEVAQEVEAWGKDPDAWYMLPWFWALGRKPG